MPQEPGSCDCPSVQACQLLPRVPTFQNVSADLRHFHSTPELRSRLSIRPCNSRREVRTTKMPLAQLARSHAPETTTRNDRLEIARMLPQPRHQKIPPASTPQPTSGSAA